MARLRCVISLTLVASTTQLSLKSEEAALDVDIDQDGPQVEGMMDFGGIFEMHDIIQQHFSKAEAGMLVGNGPAAGSEAPPETWSHPGRGGDYEERKWPTNAWKAPLGPDDNYPGKTNWPLDTTTQCDDADMKELNFWALKQAKKRLPRDGYNGTNFNGECFRYNFNGWALNVTNYAKCFRKHYEISTGCATCIGKVYNMAFFNWSQPCYNFCKGRPNRRDGAHWCWEDCQSCMWYIGKQLTTCYGEPYDMQCRYARELGREGWFEENGINPK